MKVQSRVFAREYKTRSSKSANSLIQHMLPQETPPESGSTPFYSPHHTRSTHLSRAVHREAEAVFRPRAIENLLVQSQPGDAQHPVGTGRILPCLSQLADTQTPTATHKARSKSTEAKGDLSAKAQKSLSKRKNATLPRKTPDLSLKLRGHIVSEEFAGLSNLELLSLIERTRQEIEKRQNQGREKLKEEIQAKLAHSGLDISDLFPDVSGKGRRKSSKDSEKSDSAPIPAKYRDPVSQEGWSGRGGRPPQWVKKIMEAKGWSLDDFKKSGEYDI